MWLIRGSYVANVDFPEQLARSLALAKERYLGVITDLSRVEGPEMELHNSDPGSNRCKEIAMIASPG
ncbi:hypothetical protein B5807_01245 [Epicoccum nigrum]|uniref:Uncharacterized protein n=1 Tax=Epicoccum nigrum TaxID=105696 RepID=A0A1Y2MH54_EPING|nr:hypothetical protein B5807_01245 [Epicoccum nigrum]